jgi:gluconolactonase
MSCHLKSPTQVTIHFMKRFLTPVLFFLAVTTIVSAVEPPGHFMVAPGDGQATLKWNVPAESTVNVKRGANATGAFTNFLTGLTTSEIVITNLNYTLTYHFALSSVSNGVESANTPVISIKSSAAYPGWLLPGAKMEKLAGSFLFVEGPVWLPTEKALIFSDIDGNRLYKWTRTNGAKVFRQPSNRANGNTLDLEGRLITGEQTGGRVTRTELDGSISNLVSLYKGKRFNAPNDVVVKNDGSIWFTDPTYGGTGQPGRYVYQFYPSNGNGTVSLVASNFAQPNGLAFSPDFAKLYVTDSERNQVRHFEVLPGNTLSNLGVFANINPGAADGMRVHSSGKIYSSGGRFVHILNTNGTLEARLPVPEDAANLAFGGADGEMLFVTARTSLYGITRMPDLRIVSVVTRPAQPLSGDDVQFDFVIKNQGTAGTGTEFNLEIIADIAQHPIEIENFIGDIPPDSTLILRSKSSNPWPAELGIHPLSATIDPSNHLEESQEYNNTNRVNISVQPGGGDADSDGASDRDETLAGTDPKNPESLLRILSLSSRSGEPLLLEWAAVSGKSYQIAYRDSLIEGSWLPLGDLILATNTTMIWNTPNPRTNDLRFFKVRLSP